MPETILTEEKNEQPIPDTPEQTAANVTTAATPAAAATPQASSPAEDDHSNDDSLNDDPFEDDDEEQKSFLHFSSIRSRKKAELTRDELILSRIRDKDLMEYLRLEQERQNLMQSSREIREKRIWIAFQLTVSLIAAVLVIYFLKDSPTILISILYIVGILVAFSIWNKSKNKTPDDK